MKRVLTTGVATAALGLCLAVGGVTVPRASAADLPVYVPPPPAPVWSWTGPYAGLHVGAIDGDIDDNFDVEGDDIAEVPADSMDPNGIMGGLQAGYNFQFDSIVLGVEGDISFGDVDDVIYPSLFSPSGRIESQIDWMATIRARVGWAWDRTLFYATGGMAFTDLKIKVDDDLAGFNDSDKNSYFGWTVGGGVEHAVSDSISLKAEYLYADFGKESYSFSDTQFPDVKGDVKLTTHTFRVGVNWLF